MERRLRDDQRKQATRRRLLDAAARVLVRDGYHGAVISDIVAEAGVGQGTFYRHFKDKRDVLTTLFEDFIARLFAQFSPMSERLPANVEEYHDTSLAAVRRAAAIAEEHLDLIRLFIWEGPAIDRAFEEQLEAVYDRFAALAQYFLDYAIAEGFARPCDSAVVSQALVGMGLRLLKSATQGALATRPREQVIAEAVALAFHGFGLYPTERPKAAKKSKRMEGSHGR
jgi:AcrR family transcriptional regulator